MFPSPQLAARLSAVASDIPEIVQIMAALVKMEKCIKIDETKVENLSVESNVAEHELNQYSVRVFA